MTGVDLITAALAAGATAGVTGVATAAIEDLYRGLREGLRKLLPGHGPAAQALTQLETDAQVWAADLGPDLVQVGADRNEEILATARLLLTLTGAAQSGGNRLHVENNYGAAAGQMTGPITINHGRETVPPAKPEAT